MEAIPAFSSFEDASTAALRVLQERLGYRLWMVTRRDGDDWIVLASEDRGYGVGAGEIMQWSDSFCSRMVTGEGPRFAARSNEIGAYKSAPISSALEINAYIGVPLQRADGSLFGTLCAIDPHEQTELGPSDRELVELVARLLATVIERELTAVDRARQLERLRVESTLDPLTGLRNRRGWEQAITDEEARSNRFGSPASVFIIDLDGLKAVNDTQGHHAGDRLLRRTGEAIRSVVRETDVAARIGGDEFGLLAVECDAQGAADLDARLASALEGAGISASIGHATRDPRHGLTTAWEEADRRMYSVKAERRRRG